MTMIEFPNTTEAIEALGRAEQANYKAEARERERAFLDGDPRELQGQALDPRSSGNLLDRLSRSEDWGIRNAVAENEATRESTLVRLAKMGHCEAFYNPSMSLLKVEELANWPHWTDWRNDAWWAWSNRTEALITAGSNDAVFGGKE